MDFNGHVKYLEVSINSGVPRSIPIIIAHFWNMEPKVKCARLSAQLTWGFTYNNPKISGEDLLALLIPQCKEIVFQKEKGEEGTPHFQGYVKFLKKTRTPSKVVLMPAHWLRCDGNYARYCQKEDTRIEGPWRYGGAPTQGRRTDMDACAAMIRAGKTNQQIAEKFPSQMIRYQVHMDRFRALYSPTREKELEVWLYTGKPGTGKTRCAYETYPKLFALPVGKDLWFNTYQQQEEVLIDDFAGNVGLTQLLQLLDRYPVQVPTKGGFVWWCPAVIIITTNVPIEMWYDYTTRTDSFAALKRRITHYKEFGHPTAAWDVMVGAHAHSWEEMSD